MHVGFGAFLLDFWNGQTAYASAMRKVPERPSKTFVAALRQSKAVDNLAAVDTCAITRCVVRGSVKSVL